MVLESSNMIVLISLSCLQGTPNEQLVVDAHDSRQVQHTLDCGDGPLFFFSMEPPQQCTGSQFVHFFVIRYTLVT